MMDRFKHEEWKFTPKSKVNLNSMSPPKSKGSLKLGIGPSTTQIEGVSLKDLEEENYISIYNSFPLEAPVEKKQLDRADLSSALNFKGKEFLEVTFLKNPPSVLWLDLTQLNFGLRFKLQKNQNLQIVIVDENPLEIEHPLSHLEFDLQPQAQVQLGTHFKSRNRSLFQMRAFLQEGSDFKSFSFFEGAAEYKRQEIQVFHQSAHSHLSLNGLSLAQHSSCFDFHSNIFHLNIEQSSKQCFHSLNKDLGHSIFGGRIHLLEGSTGGQVEQLNKNLILDNKAKVDTQPELNIYHDEVKASHGATTGKLHADELFYLQSRGFAPEAAQSFLLKAFASAPLPFESPNLKAYFKEQIERALP